MNRCRVHTHPRLKGKLNQLRMKSFSRLSAALAVVINLDLHLGLHLPNFFLSFPFFFFFSFIYLAPFFFFF